MIGNHIFITAVNTLFINLAFEVDCEIHKDLQAVSFFSAISALIPVCGIRQALSTCLLNDYLN